MKKSEIYLSIAKRIDAQIVFLICNVLNEYCYIKKEIFTEFFLFSPTIEPPVCNWWDLTTTGANERVIALLFCAEIAKELNQ